MATETSVNVSVAVFRGEPLDWQKFRHTALWFRFGDGFGPVVIHIVGPPQAFTLQVRTDYDPDKSTTFAKEVQVGRLRSPMTRAQLVSLVSQTPIRNSDPEFNCQVWVENALQRLKSANHLSEDEYRAGVDEMVDATMEAKDEP